MMRLLWLWLRALTATLSARRRHGPARPSWTFAFEAIVRFLRLDYADSHGWPYARLRADLDRRPLPREAIARVTQRRHTLGSVPAVTFSPPDRAGDAAVLFLHGGSYLFGSTTTHADLMARLALGLGLDVIGIDYRLAPEHTYPAALDDTLAALAALEHERSAPLALAGDSAGGNLALAAAMARRDRGLSVPPAALVSPWLDLTESQASHARNEPFDYGTRAMLLRHGRDAAGSLDPADPRLSLLHADPRSLGPLLIEAGEVEMIHDEACLFADRARDAGVEVSFRVYRDMPHNPPMLAAYHPEAQRAVDDLVAFLRQHLRP